MFLFVIFFIRIADEKFISDTGLILGKIKNCSLKQHNIIKMCINLSLRWPDN